MSELAAHWRWVAAIWIEVTLAYGAYSLYLAARTRRAERREDHR